MVESSERKIGELSTNLTRVRYNHFCTNILKKGMNPLFLLPAMVSMAGQMEFSNYGWQTVMEKDNSEFKSVCNLQVSSS